MVEPETDVGDQILIDLCKDCISTGSMLICGDVVSVAAVPYFCNKRQFTHTRYLMVIYRWGGIFNSRDRQHPRS